MTEDDIVMLWVYSAEHWENFNVARDDRLRGVKMKAWLDELGDLELNVVHAALVALGDREFIPPLGQVRAKALELASGAPRVPDHDEAWSEVMDGMRRHGRRQKPTFSHPVISEVVDQFRWVNLCNADDLDVLRGQFRRAYETARARFIQESQPPPPAVAALQSQRPLPQANRVVELPRRRHEQG